MTNREWLESLSYTEKLIIISEKLNELKKELESHDKDSPGYLRRLYKYDGHIVIGEFNDWLKEEYYGNN